MKVRIAFTANRVTFTRRGKSASHHTRGFIRRCGKTISGYTYDWGTEVVFYPDEKGINFALAYIVKEAA